MGAFGPCMMCRKDTYFEVGGHTIAKQTVTESIPLGQEFIKAGHTVHCYGGKGAIFFRMYPQGIRSLVEGFSKGFAKAANTISTSALIMLVCWVFGGVSLTRHLIESIIVGNNQELYLWLVMNILYIAQIQWMLFRIGNFGIATAILFQIPLIFFVVIFSLSMLKMFGVKKARWKGRTIEINKTDKSP